MSIEEMLKRKKYRQALSRLRAEFERGDRSLELRLQYAEVLEKAEQPRQAVPVLLGLARELSAGGDLRRSIELLERALRLEPGREDIALRLENARLGPSPKPPEPEEGPVTRSSGPQPESCAAKPAAPNASEPACLEAAQPEQPSQGAVLEAPESAPVLSAEHEAPATVGLAAAVEVEVGVEAGVVTDGTQAPGEANEAEGELVVVVAEDQGPGEAALHKAQLVSYLLDLATRFEIRSTAEPTGTELPGALFAALSEEEVERLLPGLRRRDFDAGHAMVTEGERGGQALFILGRGHAKVLVRSAHERHFQVAEIEAGSFFGEISLLGRPRVATVVAVDHCETLEIDSEALEFLASRRPLARQILEETLLARAISSELAAVRSVPAMDPDTPLHALRLFEAQFGQKHWSPRMRLRLAETLAGCGSYRDVVPILVGLADQLASEGQHERALAVLKKIETVDRRDPEERSIPPLERDATALAATARLGGPGSLVTIYVANGQPVPTAKGIDHFRRWVHALMRRARGEARPAPSTTPLSCLDTQELLSALEDSCRADASDAQGSANQPGARVGSESNASDLSSIR